MHQDIFVTVVDGENIEALIQEAEPVSFAFIAEQGPEGIPGSDGSSIHPIDHVAQPPVYEGVVSSGNLLSIQDDSANWVQDEFIDKVVKIVHADGTYCIGVVESNDSNTLFFDDELLDDHTVGDAYQIMDTVVVPESVTPTMIAIDTMTNNRACAVLLPEVSPEYERVYVHSYIERAINGQNICPVVCRRQNRQAGQKYGELIHRQEGVRLYQHTFGVPHWDIIQVYNIKRLAAGYWLTEEPIQSDTFSPVGLTGRINYDYKKRFSSRVEGGYEYLVYTSLLQRDFLLAFTCNIEKSGGVGEASISFMTIDADTGVQTVHTERISTSRFATGLGRETISVEIPVTLDRGDRVIPVALHSGGTFTVQEGSTVRVTEL